MLEREIMPGVALRLWEESDADELHDCVEANRAHLARWMPWAATQTRAQTLEFIRLTRRQIGNNDGVQTAITAGGRIVGSVGLHQVIWAHRSTSIGYWVADSHQGRGIITIAVAAYLDYAFATLELERVVLTAAVGNHRSRAIARRLGFIEEGVLRAAEVVNGRAHDLVVYSRLASDPASELRTLRGG
jgi:ribosomal-protein-serine acetyltransferase